MGWCLVCVCHPPGQTVSPLLSAGIYLVVFPVRCKKKKLALNLIIECIFSDIADSSFPPPKRIIKVYCYVQLLYIAQSDKTRRLFSATWEKLKENLRITQWYFKVIHQGFRHDDANLAFGQQGEVGKQALQDKLARFTLGVHVYRCHDDRTLPLSRGTADWWDRWL